MPVAGGFRLKVLCTVSAAVMMMAADQVSAAEIVAAGQGKWWLSLEGQYQLYGGDSVDYSGAPGGDYYPQFAMPDDGWSMGGEFGFRPADGPWSFVGRLRYGQSGTDKLGGSYADLGEEETFTSQASARHRETQIIADLEIGRDVGLGMLGEGASLRVFGGVRFGQFKGKGAFSSSFYFSGYGGQFQSSGGTDLDIERTFIGAGPRIGVDAMMPLPLVERVSLSVGVAGALLFGKQKLKASGSYFTYFGSGNYELERSDAVVVPNLETSLALSWLVSESAKFSLGYRIDRYFDVYDISGGRDIYEEGDRVIHGPFLKISIGGG